MHKYITVSNYYKIANLKILFFLLQNYTDIKRYVYKVRRVLYLRWNLYHHLCKHCPSLKSDFFAFEVNKMGERGLLMAMAVERAGVPGGLDEGQVRGPCSVMNKWAYKYAFTHTRGRVFVQLICHFRSSKVMKNVFFFMRLLLAVAVLQIHVKCPPKKPHRKPMFTHHGIGQVPLFQDSGC